MNLTASVQLIVATAAFIGGASLAKSWAMNPTLIKAVITLLLYTGGNILMLHLVRLLGMATAFSVSNVLQLLTVTLVAVLVYGEKLNAAQGLGVFLAILAVVLISFGPRWGS